MLARCWIKCCLPGMLLVVAGGLREVPAAGEGNEESDLYAHYGFLPLEIFKLEERSANMVSADLNSDGLTDLALVDNSHSRLDLLIQRSDYQTPGNDPTKPGDANEIHSDTRFKMERLAVDRQVQALTTGDFDHDGRTDLAYFGLPDRVVVRYQPESGLWKRRAEFRVPDVAPVSWTMDGGDLNHDGRDDLVIVGTKATLILYQTPDGELAPPESLMNTSDRLGLVRISDLDGDGRNDLCYQSSEDSERGLCARMQGPDGRPGPELRFDLRSRGGVILFNMDGRPGDEVLTIDPGTGRVAVSQFHPPQPQPGEPASRLIRYGFGEAGSGKDRDCAVGDPDGDGRTDVVVTDPDAAQILLFRQHADQGLDPGTKWPGLLGTSQIRCADLDGDGRDEVIVMSSKEKVIAVSRFEDGRLTFPQVVSLASQLEPVALETADVDRDGRPDIVYIARHRHGRQSSWSLRAVSATDDGDWRVASAGQKTEVELDLKGTPDRLVRLDADGDLISDFLVFFDPARPPLFLKTDSHGTPVQTDLQGGIRIGEVSASAVFAGRSPGLLVAKDSFARRLRFADGHWQVADQYNSTETSSRIVGVAMANLDQAPGEEIVLIDTGVRKLHILREVDGVHKPWKEAEPGSFDYRGARVADFDGDGSEDLLLFSGSRFAVLYSGRSDPVLETVATYETQLEKVYLTDLVVGDLNGDGMSDVVVVDTRSHFLEVLNYHADRGLKHAMHFQLFEEKSFSSERQSDAQPREGLIADVTGDGRSDLVLLTHDRVLLYPQDAGPGGRDLVEASTSH